MKKNTISKETMRIALLARDTSKDVIKSFWKGEKRASFSIICRYDDKSPDFKAAVRDTRLEDFDKFFDNAINMAPDYIIVKVFNGPGPDAFEVTDSENTIRLKDAKKTVRKEAKFALQGTQQVQLPETQHQNEGSASMELRQHKFESQMIAEKLAYQNERTLEKKDEEIEKLKKEKADLEAEIKEYEIGVTKLEAETEDLKSKFGLNAEGVFKAGLAAFASIAAKNPAGKMLGVIPNATLAGLMGMSSDAQLNENNQAGAKTYKNGERSEQIAAFVDGLEPDEFEKAFTIFINMAAAPGNVTQILSLIQGKPGTNPKSD